MVDVAGDGRVVHGEGLQRHLHAVVRDGLPHELNLRSTPREKTQHRGGLKRTGRWLSRADTHAGVRREAAEGKQMLPAHE